MSNIRQATVSRKTNETEITITLNLDGTGQAEIKTGVGFFDHMLHALARHARFDLAVQANGDLYIDEHHTVEDVGITLGRALNQALGDRKGITRMGQAIVPMDEALAMVAVDIGGRGYFVFDGHFEGERIGQMGTSLIPHFFESLAHEAKLNLHARLLAGRDDHHRAEALFKALARTLNQAVKIDPQLSGQIPSTKGAIEH
ncbi:MAG: imidazoleglycerol-phosphate dehydratase HisB [Phycisphaerae bacterium]|nr:imidazoleglycerol-phosphate dehydratase HisB [Phycisphaerae bacterium]NIV02329.1 imidazoleglycerol-phosphate dehydratase HisB [Phycisphaerae bacterium]NIV69280.1 imidazoleglycerol-phosphate dehydratase HisB [Phycisphaerae bacterium]NIW92718.1 imidazoleglycerol-phosphate dehydratase HisB [Phycisphaerae bacterium]NIX27762.1 imidazoleglycerol-phosphate dehydratase HisB [Phycisphaerae bacterium]